MKVELIKQLDHVKDEVWFKIHIDGSYLSGTLDRDESKVRETYDRILKNQTLKSEESILSTEIN